MQVIKYVMFKKAKTLPATIPVIDEVICVSQNNTTTLSLNLPNIYVVSHEHKTSTTESKNEIENVSYTEICEERFGS